MGKQLAGERQAFDQSAMQPMELSGRHHAADGRSGAVQDAGSASEGSWPSGWPSLKGRDREDNPALQARMRELEEEQREVREALNRLLNDIEENVKKLPDDEQLDKLRETASEFVERRARERRSQAMSEAEAGLAEFSGTIGYAKAKEAADMLEKFLKKCNGMGDQAGDCDPIFQPGMGNCMKKHHSFPIARNGQRSPEAE